MSLRQNLMRRGLYPKIALLLVGCCLPLGCAQGPRSVFSRAWGVTFKDATRSLTRLVRRDKDPTSGAVATGGEVRTASAAMESGETENAAGSGQSARPKQANIVAKGKVFAAFVQKRSPKVDLVEDPFLSDVRRVEFETAARSTVDNKRAENRADDGSPAADPFAEFGGRRRVAGGPVGPRSLGGGPVRLGGDPGRGDDPASPLPWIQAEGGLGKA